MGVGGLSQPAAVFLDRDGVINRNVMNPLNACMGSAADGGELCVGEQRPGWLCVLYGRLVFCSLLFPINQTMPRPRHPSRHWKTYIIICCTFSIRSRSSSLPFTTACIIRRVSGPAIPVPVVAGNPRRSFSFKRATSSVWTWSAPGWSVIAPATSRAARRRACIPSTCATRKRMVLPWTGDENWRGVSGRQPGGCRCDHSGRAQELTRVAHCKRRREIARSCGYAA